MRLEDAWRPVDEVAGTGVDTFVYGLSRDDGLFYPSRVGQQFGADRGPAERELSAYWRVSENMASLEARGLDPLQVLIDRAHEKSMDFIASLRMGATPGLDPSLSVANGGEGYANPQVVRHQLAVLTELSADYPLDALELDFSASPGGSSLCFPYGSGPQHMPIMTEFLREAASMARAHGVQIGVRCYPTEELNRRMGLDITGWLREGLIDFCVPMLYIYFVLDANMPIEWLVEEAHAADISVYPVLQPYYAPDTTAHPLLPVTHHATIPPVRAAAANFWAAGCDGLYAWFCKRAILLPSQLQMHARPAATHHHDLLSPL